MRSSPHQVTGLAVVQIADAAFNVAAREWMRANLEHLRIPYGYRHVFPIVKTASAAGLLAGLQWAPLGRLTARLLVVYYILAMLAHYRVKDPVKNYVPAAAMLAWSALAQRTYTTPTIHSYLTSKIHGSRGSALTAAGIRS
jgi:DoxX-like family